MYYNYINYNVILQNFDTYLFRSENFSIMPNDFPNLSHLKVILNFFNQISCNYSKFDLVSNWFFKILIYFYLFLNIITYQIMCKIWHFNLFKLIESYFDPILRLVGKFVIICKTNLVKLGLISCNSRNLLQFYLIFHIVYAKSTNVLVSKR